MKRGRIAIYITMTILMIGIAVAIVILAVKAAGNAKANEDKTTHVHVGDEKISMSIIIPDGWEYETSGTSELYTISFWPKGRTDGKLTLRGSNQVLFGVCGTGLVEEKSFIGTYQVRHGFFDGNSIWDYTAFTDFEEYVLINDGASTWWHQYEEEIETILKTIVLGEGL